MKNQFEVGVKFQLFSGVLNKLFKMFALWWSSLQVFVLITFQIQQNTSLELAKAIRELEESTKALNSAYDTDAVDAVTSNGVSSNGEAVCGSGV